MEYAKISSSEKYKALNILQYLQRLDIHSQFSQLVFQSPYLREIYMQVIKKPMTFSRIRKNLIKKKYQNFWQFWNDLELVWENCRNFNNPSSEIVSRATELEQQAVEFMRKMITNSSESGLSLVQKAEISEKIAFARPEEKEKILKYLMENFEYAINTKTDHYSINIDILDIKIF